MKLLGFYNEKAYIFEVEDDKALELKHVVVTRDMMDWAARQTSEEEKDNGTSE